MGSGKSTIGPTLAEAISYQFIDFDNYIELKEGMAISQIFKKKGEISFRKIETKCLEELIGELPNNTIVALGGGTPCYGNNLRIIKESNAKTVYLNLNFKLLANRLWDDKVKRPLIASMQSYEILEDYVRKHLFERGFYYNQADVIIKMDEQNPKSITKEIISRLF